MGTRQQRRNEIWQLADIFGPPQIGEQPVSTDAFAVTGEFSRAERWLSGAITGRTADWPHAPEAQTAHPTGEGAIGGYDRPNGLRCCLQRAPST